MNKREKKKIINNIEDIIDESDYTKATLSKASGIPYPSLTNIFVRGTMPGVDMILKMCKTLKVSPTQLLTGKTDELYLNELNKENEKNG